MMKKLMLKKTWYRLALIIFFFTAILPAAGLDTVAFAVGAGQPDIDVILKEYVELKAGETGSLTLTFKNNSTTTSARSIYFLPNYQKDSDNIFTDIRPITEMPVKYLTSYDGKIDMEISVTVDKFAAEGIYSLPFKLKYSYAVPEPPNYSAETIVEMSVNVMVKNDKRKAELVLESDGSVLAPAGGTFELPVTVRNKGDFIAKDIKVSIKDPSPDTFALVSGSGRYDIDILHGEETKTLKYLLRVSSSFKTGSYPLQFSLEYSDERGTVVNEDQKIWIPVSGSGGTGTVFEVLEITPSKTTVKPADIFDVSVKVKNSGAYDSGQVRISAEGTSVLLPVSQNLYIIQSIKKDETKVINFKFQPHPEAPRGGVPITIRVEPVDGGETAISQAISVFVDSDTTGGSEPGKNVPKLIIKSYSSEPTLVNAGENFNLTMQFLNTHSTREVRNIKGSFSVTESSSETGNVFTPVGSSNTFYIDKISPQKTADWNVTLYTIPDAKSKTYTMSIFFEYEDDLGTSHTATEIIGIPVYQPSRFEVSEISLPPETFIGQPVYTGFEMYNLGKTEIYNVKLRVEGDFDAQPKSNYFGNFESGRVEYYELNLIPMMPGQANGSIIFQYENASGEVHEVVKEFSMNVMEMMMPPDDGFPVDGPGGKPGIPGMEEEPSKSFFKSVWFYIILGVVVVGVVVTIILVARKRKNDKEFDF